MPSNNEQDGFVVCRLGQQDDAYFGATLDLFAEAFDDAESYSGARPSYEYRDKLLSRDDFIMLVALAGQTVVGALVAYDLQKFEQERSEFYIYDLAVGEDWRRQGIATALIANLKDIARTNQGEVVYVQAGYGDAPAIALYTRLGTREDVVHFDIALD